MPHQPQPVPPYARGLNPAQQRAVLAPLDRPLLVLAGAGSGKTSVMVRRVCHMLARGVGAPRILCVTFTRAAAEEMQTRLVKAIGPRAKEATVSTFHALSLQICRAHAERAGYPKDFAVWQGRQQRRLLARTLDELRVRVAAGAADVAELPPPAKWAEPERLLQRLARAKAKGDAPEDVADPLLSACYARYVEQMRAAGALDFLDLIRVAFELLESHADVRASLRARHTHVLVDEFQDTNALQLRLLRLLAPHTAADGGENRAAVTVVGDDDQAIYSFQGAAGSFKGFEAAYPGAASVTLDQNYRSSGTIVDAAAAVVASNAARTPKAPFTHNGGGERVQIVECRTAACEARHVVSELRAHAAAGGKLAQAAILFRTARVGEEVQAALVAARVAFNAHAQNFWARAPIRDARSPRRTKCSSGRASAPRPLGAAPPTCPRA